MSRCVAYSVRFMPLSVIPPYLIGYIVPYRCNQCHSPVGIHAHTGATDVIVPYRTNATACYHNVIPPYLVGYRYECHVIMTFCTVGTVRYSCSYWYNQCHSSVPYQCNGMLSHSTRQSRHSGRMTVERNLRKSSVVSCTESERLPKFGLLQPTTNSVPNSHSLTALLQSIEAM